MQAQFGYSLGRHALDHPRRWIDGSVSIGDAHYEFVANLHLALAPDRMVMNRFSMDIPARFGAEQFLALLAHVAAPPFAPTKEGLTLFTGARSQPILDRIARLLDSGARLAPPMHRLSIEVVRRADAQLAMLARYRSVQLAMLSVDLWEKSGFQPSAPGVKK